MSRLFCKPAGHDLTLVPRTIKADTTTSRWIAEGSRCVLSRAVSCPNDMCMSLAWLVKEDSQIRAAEVSVGCLLMVVEASWDQLLVKCTANIGHPTLVF